MEALLVAGQQNAEETLIGELRYGLDSQGTYIHKRRMSSTFSAVNIASPKTVKQVSFNLASTSEWCDPSTVVLSMLIRETGGDANKPLFPAGVNPAILFDRLQIRLGSTLVEDIQGFNKLSHMMGMYSMSPGKARDMAIMGFGVQETAQNPNVFLASQFKAKKIPANGTKRIYMKFDLSGLLSQHRFIPLWALGGQGLSISLSIDDPKNSLILADAADATQAAYSSEYQLEDIRCLCDMVSLQDDLHEAYLSSLLNGTALRIVLRSWECQTVYLPADNAGTFDTALSKNYTRLASLFAYFNTHDNADGYGTHKYVNSSFFPGTNDAIENVQVGLHLGSRRLPDNDMRGTSEVYLRLISALGMRDTLAHSTSIDEFAFNNTHHAIGFDLEKVSQLMASGENLSNGATILLRIKNFIGASATAVPRIATVCAHFEKIISIQDTLVEVNS